jgi:23S rRNA (guanosine2251-2'-O)-methyltransferase
LVTGRRAVLELLRAGRGAERVYLAQGLAPSQALGEIRRRAAQAAVPVRSVPKSELDRLAGGLNHQGVAARTGAYRYASLHSILGSQPARVLLLEGVMDPHNLGALLRSACVAGFDGVVIPARRAVGVTDAVRRVSQGAAELVSVARVSRLSAALAEIAAAGLWVVGLDEAAGDSLWSSPALEPPVALLLGAEDRGLTSATKARCDSLVRIPARGSLRSLNVGVAGAVAMFEVARRGELP